jgi:GWxTD domain-containing protein
MALDPRARRFFLAAIAIAALPACAWLGHDPSDPAQSLDTALARGDTARALKLVDGVVPSASTPAQYYALSGALYRSLQTIPGRVRSQRVLELGLRHYPDHADLWSELGKTHYDQTFYGDAARCFRRVLALDPGNCVAHFYLGLDGFRKWKYIQVYTQYLRGALPHFTHVAQCDPQNRVASYRLALSKYALGDTLGAIAHIESFMATFPSAPEGYLLRGAIAYQREDYARCDSLFDIALPRMSDEERSAVRDISLLLPEDDMYEYTFASAKKREGIERVFWAELDPDPTTRLNERRLEHVQRMFLADTFFDNERPRMRGWETERGKALVKFGWPDGVNTTLAGEFLSGPMEVWVYSNPFVGMTLFFRDEFLNGNYMVPMDHRFAFSAQSLYLDPPASYYVSPYWQIPGVMEVVSFRNGSASTDVYVALAIDRATLREYAGIEPSGQFVLRTNVFDADWREQAAQVDTLAGSAVLRRTAAEHEALVLVRRFNLGFDSLRVASCLEDDRSRTQALMNGRTNTLKYLTDAVVMSDILLYRPASPGATTHGIERPGGWFVPNPGGAYGDVEKLRLYVEIYNLGMVESRSDYEIRYSIFAADDRAKGWAGTLKRLMGFAVEADPVITQTFQRRGDDDVGEENLVIDIEALSPGDYMLQVSVTDRASGGSATQSRPFSKARSSDAPSAAAR